MHHLQSKLFYLVVFCTYSSIVYAMPSEMSETNVEINSNGTAQASQLSEALQELELAEKLEEMDNSTRESRGLLKKVAFLAGMRVGGFVQSSGTLAASNSLRVFGKVVNSAVSVSYGTLDDLNPVPPIEEEIEGRPIISERPGVLSERPVIEVPANVKITTVGLKPAQLSINDSEAMVQRKVKEDFLKKHNDLVNRANANSRYLRSSRSGNLEASSTAFGLIDEQNSTNK